MPGESDPSPSRSLPLSEAKGSGLQLMRGGVTIDGMPPGDRGGRPYMYRFYPRERANSRSSRRLPAGGPPPRLKRLNPSSPFSQITSSILALKIDE